MEILKKYHEFLTARIKTVFIYYTSKILVKTTTLAINVLFSTDEVDGDDQ